MKQQNYPSGEYKLLQSLKPLLNYKKNGRYPIGIGDDAAIRLTKAGEKLVFTADSMVENIHFSLNYMTFEEVGYKAMAVNLSDLAAMGASPDAAMVQIVFPSDKKSEDVARSMHCIYEGFNEACRTWNFPIIGGNLSKGPTFIIDITLIGRTEKNSRLLLRKGAKNGDGLWMTGFPGQSAAGLFALQKWETREKIPRNYRPFIQKHKRPIPRIEMGQKLVKNSSVHCMIDISDGIAKECRTLSFDNNLGIMLDLSNTSFLEQLKGIGAQLDIDPLKWFLYGGEDYELLFSASPRFSESDIIREKIDSPLTKIGTFSSKVKGVQLRLNNDTIIKVEKRGWDNLKVL